MSKVCEITVNVDEALSVNKYEVDEEAPHIVLAEDDVSVNTFFTISANVSSPIAPP